MTAPEDPFRTPPPGGTPPPGTHPYGDQVPHDQPPGQPYGDQQQLGQASGDQQYGQPQYGQPQYGQPYGGPAFGEHRAAPRNGLGVAALVLGILALLTGLFFLGGLLGIAAIVLGVLGRGRAKRGEATNGGMAIAGIVLGALGLLLTALAVFGTVALFNDEGFSNLTECLQDAGSDAEAQQQCQTDFADRLGS